MNKNKNNSILVAEFLGSFFITYFMWLIFHQINNNTIENIKVNYIAGISYFSFNFVIMILFASSSIICSNPFLTIMNKLITLRSYSIIKTLISQITGSIFAGLFLFLQNKLKIDNNIINNWNKLYFPNFNVNKNSEYYLNYSQYLINNILSHFLIGFFYFIAFKKKFINKYTSSLIISTVYLVIIITMLPYIGFFINPIIFFGPGIFSLYFNLEDITKILFLPFIGLSLGIYMSKFIYREEGFENDSQVKEIKVDINILKPKKVTFGI